MSGSIVNIKIQPRFFLLECNNHQPKGFILISHYLIRTLIFGVFSIVSIQEAYSQAINIYADTSIGQIKFAASDIQMDLSKRGQSSQILSLGNLGSAGSVQKVVIALASNTSVTDLLVLEGGTIPAGLGPQSYGLQTTTKGQTSYWIIGGDQNGAMYGGLQMAENIRFNGFTGTYNSQEAPAVMRRGIKLNLPLDAVAQTYGGKTASSKVNAIPNAWDLSFWTTWFDEMARNRYNVISIWSNHPFTSMIKMADYPDAAIQNVKGLDSFTKIISIDEKIAFWKRVMAYAHARGFEFYLFNWNLMTDNATGKYGITDGGGGVTSKASIDYMRKCMSTLWETYPDLDGFGITQGENMTGNDVTDSKFLGQTYGSGTADYAKSHPERTVRLIHRWHLADFTAIKANFSEVFKLSNVDFAMSFKYSLAHMYSAALPQRMTNKEIGPLVAANLKSFLTVRNDDFFYHDWGDPEFARAYINGMINKGSWYAGFYMGSDGYSPTRTFFSKNSVSQGKLEIQRQWYMFMLWGRLSYNPGTSDNVFKNSMASRFPGLNSSNLFIAWQKASRVFPVVGDLITGTLGKDSEWWPEACQSGNGFLTIADFAGADPSIGSSLASIAATASGQLGGGKSALTVANEIEADAKSALSSLPGIISPDNSEAGVTLNNIRALSYLGNYYAFKIRGAVLNKTVNKQVDARASMGTAYCWWMNYSNLMDGMYTGMTMARSMDLPNWHAHDKSVLKEYTDLGGTGTPNCSEVTGSLKPVEKRNGQVGIRLLKMNGIVFELPKNGLITLSIFNSSGKMVLQNSATRNKGLNEVMFSKPLEIGLYFVRIQAGGARPIFSKSMMINSY